MKPDDIISHLNRARDHSMSGQHHIAMEALIPLLEKLEASPEEYPLSTVVDAYLLAMRTCIGLENMEDIFRYYHLLVDASEKSEDFLQLTRIHRAFGFMWRSIGMHFNALEDLKIAMDFAEERQDESEIAALHNDLGLTLSELGSFSEAEEHLSKAMALLKKFSGPREKQNLCGAANNRGLNNEFRGEYTLALEYYNTALEIATETGNTEKMARILVNRGRLLVRIDDPDAAEKDIDAALEHNRENNIQDITGGAYLAKALIKLKHNEVFASKELYKQAENAFSQNMSTIHGGMVAFLWGSALMDMGLAEDAEKHLDRAVHMFGDAGNETFLNTAERMLERCKQGV